MKDYIQANMAAYEQTAEEFQSKKGIRLNADTQLADKFKSFLNEDANVLELGTGSGQLSSLLCERSLNVDAIEYVPKMAKLAEETAPRAHIIVGEFLDYDFSSKKYDGIIGIAFVHLFKAEDSAQVMAKISDLLVPNGVLMLATTIHDRTFDDMVRKHNFKTEVSRFRRHYTLQDFEALFANAGFRIVSTDVDADSEVAGKRWANVVARKIS